MFEPKCQVSIDSLNSSQTYNYLCLQQPQTLNFLNFASLSTRNDTQTQQKYKQIIFCPEQVKNSPGFPKKERLFRFDKIFKRNQKFRHAFHEDIQRLINSLLQGHNHSIFIYGAQQSEKNKILIGESQNPGILLLLFSQLFEICRQKQLEARVTVKLSAFVEKNNKFSNIFQQDDSKSLLLSSDMTEIGFFVGVPEIIIRNIKTAMKCINMIWKKILENRGKDSNTTQNVFFTIKLEIQDFSTTSQSSQQSKFCISKINIVKLANPAVIDYHKIDKSKTQKWYIDLFNYLQQNTIEKYVSTVENNKQNHKIAKTHDTNFIQYIKKVILSGVTSINCFTSLTNKICSNQCLSSFIFTNYLGQFTTKPTFKFLDFDELDNLKLKKQSEIKKQLIQKQIQKQATYYPLNKAKTNISNQQLLDQSICKLLLQIFELHQMYLQQANILQFQYSNTISEGCSILGKYLLSEQIEEFYYSKKIFLEPNYQLKRVRLKLNEIKQQLQNKQNLFFKLFTDKAKQILLDLQNNGQPYKGSNMLLKSNKKLEKKIIELDNLKYSYEIFFKICNTLTSHYAFSTNEELKSQLQKFLANKDKNVINEQKQNQVELKQFQPQKVKEKIHSLPKISTNYVEKTTKMKSPILSANKTVKQTISFYQTYTANLNKTINQSNKLNWKKYQQCVIKKQIKNKMDQTKILSVDSALPNKNSTLQNRKNTDFIYGMNGDDELTQMFTNSNVGIRTCKFKKMI